CAFPNHTSVPCDKPEIITSSANVFGLVSSNICRTKLVPNSGTPNVPVAQSMSSAVTPKGAGLEKIPITSSSSNGIVLGSIPLKSCNIRMTVGSSCPSISSFNKLSSRSEEHTSELQSRFDLVCRLLLGKINIPNQ